MGIGERWEKSELSSVDSSILCVVFSLRGNILPTRQSGTSRQKFTSAWTDPDVQWRQDFLPWDAIPNQAFLNAIWEHYCELMLVYLVAIGSPTHPVDANFRGRLHPLEITSLRIEYISLNDVRLQKVS